MPWSPKSFEPAPGWQPASFQPAAKHVRTPEEHRRRRLEIMAGRAQAEAEAAGFQGQAARGLLETVPQVAGAVGGLLGPVGAGAGGALGETLVQTGKGLAGEGFDVGAIGKEAAAQAAGAGIGWGLGKVLGRVGGTITGRVLRNRAAATRALYSEATKSGKRFDPLLLLEGVPKLLEDEAVAGIPEAVRNAAGAIKPWGIRKIAEDFMRNKLGRELTPLHLQRIKQIADEIADPIFEAARKRIAPPTAAQMKRATFFKMVADNARNALREIPGAEKLERATAAAIRQRRLVPIPPRGAPASVGQLATRTGLAGAGAGIGAMAGGLPGAAMGAIGGGLLQIPAVMNALGAALDNPFTRQLLLQTGRAAGSVANE